VVLRGSLRKAGIDGWVVDGRDERGHRSFLLILMMMIGGSDGPYDSFITSTCVTC